MTRGTVLAPSESSDCLKCFGTGMELTDAGARRCACQVEAARRDFFASIPAEFGVPHLDQIKPDTERHPRQAQAIAGVRSAPHDSYFIFGGNGAGKTFLGWAICVHAFEAGRKVVMMELDELLKQWRRFEFSQTGPKPYPWRPAILADDLKAGNKYTIFLDEIGATSPTEYAAKEFFYLLKAAHERDHQMVMTCNVTPQELQSHWSRQDAFWGNSIARRIAEYSTQVDLLR